MIFGKRKNKINNALLTFEKNINENKKNLEYILSRADKPYNKAESFYIRLSDEEENSNYKIFIYGYLFDKDKKIWKISFPEEFDIDIMFQGNKKNSDWELIIPDTDKELKKYYKMVVYIMDLLDSYKIDIDFVM